jgi:DNA-binding MarR family transcriptional regulator
MVNKRQKLLQGMIEGLAKLMHVTHKNQCFSFDGLALSRQQMMILFFVNQSEGVASVKDIARFLNVTPGAVTQFVDSLVEKQLVKREISALDRRIVNVKLHTNVKKDFGNFKKQYFASASKSFSVLNDAELSQFVGLLAKVNKFY